ncbi:unnamed protein product, partial [Porites lobata]
ATLRLIGGSRPGEGRVEIYYRGSWGTVCDDNWDIKDARVVCRQLGYPSAVGAPQRARFGQGSGKIWLDEVQCQGNETSIVNCRHRPWGVHDCSHSEDASVICSKTLRLIGGSRPGEGRVEIYYNGSWGTVCDDDWDKSDAQVVCRQLGYPSAVSAPRSARFGRGSGKIWLDNVQCQGNETSIVNCRHRPWGVHNCGHHEDASVICSMPTTTPPTPTSTSSTSQRLTSPTSSSTPPVTLRLIGGSRPGEGRVEIYYRGSWGTVCDDNWDIKDARVVCRQLGYPSAVGAPQRARFGQGSGKIWLDEVQCQGNETSIVNCRHRPWGVHDCSHSEDASVICSKTLRLIGGSGPGEGRVEIYYRGSWGTVCDDDWDKSDAGVVCRQLGYPSALSAPHSARFGQGSGKIWLDDVQCQGNETSIVNCRHRPWGVHNCGHNEDASVICSIRLRLIGGNWSGEGRVEIYYRGSWGTVCDDNWGIKDAGVVCRQLGYSSTAVSAPQRARFGQGSGKIWLDEVQCQGNETSIENCRHRPWGVHDCSHSEDASVICSKTLRLIGGRPGAGRVEIYYNGSWGTVCDDYWDKSDAQVVCRQLGYPSAVSAPLSARFGQGSGKIWLDDVQCQGNETSIVNCRHRPWGVHNCAHSEDASVICSSERDSK